MSPPGTGAAGVAGRASRQSRSRRLPLRSTTGMAQRTIPTGFKVSKHEKLFRGILTPALSSIGGEEGEVVRCRGTETDYLPNTTGGTRRKYR